MLVFMLLGGMVMQMLFLVIYFFIFKKIELLYFLFFSLCLIIFNVILIFPDLGNIGFTVSEGLRNAFVFWAIGFYYLFIINYLDKENRNPRFEKIIRMAQSMVFFAGILLLIRDIFGSRNQLIVLFCYGVYFGNYLVQAYLIFDLFRLKRKDTTTIAVGSLLMLLIIKLSLVPNYQYDEFDQNLNRVSVYILFGVTVNMLFFTFTMMSKFWQADKDIANFELIKTKELLRQRQEISNDLHDDLGATLSSLHIYSSIATKFVDENPSKAKANLGLISSGVFTLMEKINDVIWSVSAKQSNVSLLSTRLKDFFVEIFDSTEIKCFYNIEADVEAGITGLKARKFLLLIAKEAINNAIKHSKADKINLTIVKQGQYLKLLVEDNGIGIGALDFNKGNGLSNLKYRTEQLGGFLSIGDILPRGTAVECLVPLTSISA